MIIVQYKHPDSSIVWPELYGPFDSSEMAEAWIDERQNEDSWKGQFMIDALFDTQVSSSGSIQ